MTTWLHEERLKAVLSAVAGSGARRVADLGCGDGDLVVRLARECRLERLLGLDTSLDALRHLKARLARDKTRQGPKVTLVHGSLIDAGLRLRGFDCAVLVETIEHIAPDRLPALERSVFGAMRPATVILTTPNAEFNPLLGTPAHRFRHPDHRFEWSRARFRAWTAGVADCAGYAVACTDIAGRHPDLGGASQMAVFRRDA